MNEQERIDKAIEKAEDSVRKGVEVLGDLHALKIEMREKGKPTGGPPGQNKPKPDKPPPPPPVDPPIEPDANLAPVARFVHECIGLLCKLDASASSDDKEIVEYKWNLGVGEGEAFGVKAEKTYSTPGPRTITLTVKDSDGVINSLVRTIDLMCPDGFTWDEAMRTCVENPDLPDPPDPDPEEPPVDPPPPDPGDEIIPDITMESEEWFSFDGDEPERIEELTNEDDEDFWRFNFNFTGNPCGTIHATKNHNVPTTVRRMCSEFHFEISDNWKGIISPCPPPGDFKTIFYGTVGPLSGRRALHLGSQANWDGGDHYGSILWAESRGSQWALEGFTTNIESISLFDCLGKRNRLLLDMSYSTTASSTDGEIHIWFAQDGDVTYTKIHEITGINHWQEEVVVGGTTPDRFDSISLTRNKDKGINGIMYLDVFKLDNYFEGNLPLWAV